MTDAVAVAQQSDEAGAHCRSDHPVGMDVKSPKPTAATSAAAPAAPQQTPPAARAHRRLLRTASAPLACWARMCPPRALRLTAAQQQEHEGAYGSRERTDELLPFLGKHRDRFMLCDNPNVTDPHAPALLLVGWNWGAQKQIDNYLKWYFENTEFGCALVLRATAFHTYTMEQKQLAPALLRFVEWAKTHPSQQRRKVVLHFFSGSVYLYIRMLMVLREDHEEDVGQGKYGLPVGKGVRFAHIAPMVGGVVFDSTPIENDAANGANAFLVVPGFPKFLFPVYWTVLATYWYVFWGYLFPEQDRDFYKRMWPDLFRYPAVRAPVYFLYSEDDLITPYAFVEEQLARLNMDGIDASGYRFRDRNKAFPKEEDGAFPEEVRKERQRLRTLGAHVTHFIRYPAVYKQRLAAFLSQKCAVSVAEGADTAPADESPPLGDAREAEINVDDWAADLDPMPLRISSLGEHRGVTGVDVRYPRERVGAPLWVSLPAKQKQQRGKL